MIKKIEKSIYIDSDSEKERDNKNSLSFLFSDKLSDNWGLLS